VFLLEDLGDEPVVLAQVQVALLARHDAGRVCVGWLLLLLLLVVVVVAASRPI